MVLAVARKNPQFAQSLLAMIDKEVNRDTDKKRLTNIIVELQKFINKANNQL